MKAVFIIPEKVNRGFEPVMWLRSQEMIQTLRHLGVEVFPIEVNVFSEFMKGPDTFASFKSDFIIAPNFNYFLEAAVDQIQVLNSLEIPVIALWDDPLGALANFVNRYPGRLEKYITRVTETHRGKKFRTWARTIVNRLRNSKRDFRRVMSHPLLRHLSWDSGHIDAVSSLKLVERQRVKWFPIFTYSAFFKTGMSLNGTKQTKNLGFCGNLYIAMLRENSFFENDFLRELATRISDRKLQSLNTPVWNIMTGEIQALSHKVRNDYGLYDDRMSFWNYYLYVVWYAANTWVRLGVLTKVNGEVSLHGLFADPPTLGVLKEYPNLKYEGNAHNFDGLPEVYASTKINICISNTLIHSGMPSKLIECLASGGFALCDPKEDLRQFFGPLVEEIFFRSPDELNTKIDYFLAHDAEREEIVRELQARLRQRCTLESFFDQVIDYVKAG